MQTSYLGDKGERACTSGFNVAFYKKLMINNAIMCVDDILLANSHSSRPTPRPHPLTSQRCCGCGKEEHMAANAHYQS